MKEYYWESVLEEDVYEENLIKNEEGFAAYAEQSAATYYTYLSKHNSKGVVENEVAGIKLSFPFIDLSLYKPLLQPDDVQVRIYNDIFEQDQIRPVCYRPLERVLRLRIADSCRHVFDNIPVSAVCLISDLRFLVLRVKEWYKNYGDYIAYPSVKPLCLSPARPENASDNQWDAITGVLSSPLSYVWGAPGTGKTRFVLANCILAYYLAEKKVYVVAPTNNAIEQVLYGVLDEMEKAGVSISRVLRIGTPSSDFLTRYPDLCEDKTVDRLHQEIEYRIKELQSQQKGVEVSLSKARKYNKYLSDKNAALSALSSLDLSASAISNIGSAILAIQEKQSLKKDKLMIYEHELSELSNKKQLVLHDIEAIRSKIQKYEKSIFRPFFASRREKCIEQMSSLHVTLDSTIHRIEAVSSALSQEKSDIQALDNTKAQQDIALQAAASDFKTCLEQLNALSFISPVKLKDTSEARSLVSTIQQLLSTTISSLDEMYQGYDELEESELLSSHAQLNNEIEDLIARRSKLDWNKVTESRIENALLVAITVDGLIGRIRPDKATPPSHLFLDEAAYCSLIKGATLLSFGCPVSFFGDHKQLSPICEMPKGEISQPVNQSVALWAQSVLYVDEVLSFSESSPSRIYQEYHYSSAPGFDSLRKFDLTCTYRFGNSLSCILAEFGIYSRDFHSAENAATEIFFIDAPKSPSDGPRDSLAERQAVAKYYSSHPGENIGILTPYRDQYSKLFKNARTRARESIFTVHRSQGREWDTVLFSIACTKNHYFVDSNFSVGKTVVNTAISRAKKRIIIVCDVDYWSAQKGQLIEKILSVALPTLD